MSWQSTPLAGLRMSGKRAGQVRERDRRRKQRIRARDRQGGRSASSSRRRYVQVARCDGATWPTWLDTSLRRCAMECAAERHLDVARRRTRRAPARSLRMPQAAARSRAPPPTRWCGSRGRSPVGAASGAAKRGAELAHHRGARRLDVDHRHRPRRSLRAQPRHQQPEHARPDHRDAARPCSAAPSQVALSAVSMLAASDRRARAAAVRQRHNIFSRKVKRGLVRIKRKTRGGLSAPPDRLRRAPTIA